MDYGRVLLRLVCGGGRGERAYGSSKRALPVKRLEQARLWLLEFLNTSINSPCRSFPMGANDETPVTITTDASPDALVAILVVQGIPIAALSSQVTLQDARELKFAKGQSSSQGVVEALAIYVALRVWKEKLKGQRLNLTVQSDSVTALALTQRYPTPTPGSTSWVRSWAFSWRSSKSRRWCRGTSLGW